MRSTLKTKQRSKQTPMQSYQNYKITSLMHFPLAIWPPKRILTIIHHNILNEITYVSIVTQKLKEWKGRKKQGNQNLQDN